MHKIGQSGKFLGRFLGPLIKTGLLLMKNVLKPLAKSVLKPLELTAAGSATNVAIQRKMFWSGMKTLMNEEINGIMKIDRVVEESSSMVKGVCETIKN